MFDLGLIQIDSNDLKSTYFCTFVIAITFAIQKFVIIRTFVSNYWKGGRDCFGKEIISSVVTAGWIKS